MLQLLDWERLGANYWAALFLLKQLNRWTVRCLNPFFLVARNSPPLPQLSESLDPVAIAVNLIAQHSGKTICDALVAITMLLENNFLTSAHLTLVLRHAVKAGSLRLFKFLASIIHRPWEPNDFSLFILAVKNGQTTIMEELVLMGMAPPKPFHWPICEAARRGHTSTVESMLKDGASSDMAFISAMNARQTGVLHALARNGWITWDNGRLVAWALDIDDMDFLGILLRGKRGTVLDRIHELLPFRHITKDQLKSAGLVEEEINSIAHLCQFAEM
ncbi:hypothetical protein HDU97_003775 [Phlyctochytrium planicorne]|nr:hypothetical protein HDU97_003775 [Phlyctochytrium planicorne]